MDNRRGEKVVWTNHAKRKVRYYRLSESRVKRVIRHPVRVEEGILEGAIAAMQPAGGRRYSEVWAMYLLIQQGGSLPANRQASANSPRRIASIAPRVDSGGKKIKIITAWRYPGKSPSRNPIPAEILREVRHLVS